MVLQHILVSHQHLERVIFEAPRPAVPRVSRLLGGKGVPEFGEANALAGFKLLPEYSCTIKQVTIRSGQNEISYSDNHILLTDGTNRQEQIRTLPGHHFVFCSV